MVIFIQSNEKFKYVGHYADYVSDMMIERSGDIRVSVTISKTKAVLSIDSMKNVRTHKCTNSEYCTSTGIVGDYRKCPHYCEIVVAAKRFANNRRVKAEIKELAYI